LFSNMPYVFPNLTKDLGPPLAALTATSQLREAARVWPGAWIVEHVKPSRAFRDDGAEQRRRDRSQDERDFEFHSDLYDSHVPPRVLRPVLK